VFALRFVMPQSVWDWSMRRLGYLTPAVLESGKPSPVPVPVPVPVPDRSSPRAQA
jgi:hypothetical protein